MEKFIVSARKYRPATFKDVVGQGAISSTLKNSIQNKHLGHAYLFSGPRGVGKTTCARIFARTINCTQIQPDGEACNTCESCKSFNENRSYNIHELDAASNNSVDDIRTLTEQVRIPPQVGTYSIYIIDEVHMLSQAAFNAFLKTLEEPPAHAIFILATTEKHKIIPTILSRCQIFDFNRIRVEDAVEYLKGIAEKESMDYEEEALNVIALKADGAMRDALSIFDQVVSFSGEKISYQDVISNLNILDYEYYFRLTSYALEGDVPSMLLLFDEVLSGGFDARNFINGYSAHLRDLMVSKDPQTIQLMEVGAGFRDKYLAQSRQVPLHFLYDGLEICNDAEIQFRSSRNQRLTIELALVKLAGLTEAQKKKSLSDALPEENASPEPVKDTPPATPSKEAPAAASGAVPRPGASAEEKSDVESHQEEPREEPAAKASAAPVQQVHKPSISIKGSLKGEISSSRAGEVGPVDAPGADENEVSSTAGYKNKEADPELVRKAWMEYADGMEKSHPRIYSTLKNNPPKIDETGSVKISLNSEAQQDNFNRNIKPGLVAHIRERTRVEGVEIRTEVMAVETEKKKIYTDEDKYQFLAELNPELQQLKNHFGLDFDQ